MTQSLTGQITAVHKKPATRTFATKPSVSPSTWEHTFLRKEIGVRGYPSTMAAACSSATNYDYGDHIVVSIDGQHVFDESKGDLRTYVRGLWEKTLDRLYGIAQQKAAEVQAARVLEDAQKRAGQEATPLVS